MDCTVCGSTERLQRHHVSYHPEEIVILCVDCHNNSHEGHGVGRGKDEFVHRDAQKFVMLWKTGVPYTRIMEEFKISFATVNNWRKALLLKSRLSKKTPLPSGKLLKIFLKGEDAKKFKAIQAMYNVLHRSEVIRICISNCYKELENDPKEANVDG